MRHRALGLTPTGVAAGRVALERDAGRRLSRLAGASFEQIRRRVRPTKPQMRSLSVATAGRLRWKTVPAPAPPGPLAAVVRPIAIATCDMDRPVGLGRTPFPLPLHFGHECVAEVLQVGHDVHHISRGNQVVVPFQINCGHCRPCREGRTANCLSVPPLSMYGFGIAGGHWGGVIADQVAVPFADAMLVPLPKAVDPAAAASVADNVCDGYRHVAPFLPPVLQDEPKAEILILAAVKKTAFTPSVPLYAGLVARALGALRISFADVRPSVRHEAERLGFSALDPSELARRDLSPLVVDVSASPAGLRLALKSTAPDGVCSSAGMLHGSARMPIAVMYGRNATLHVGRAHARALIPEVLQLMVEKRLRPELVTTRIAAIDDAAEALADHLNGQSTKTVLIAD